MGYILKFSSHYTYKHIQKHKGNCVEVSDMLITFWSSHFVMNAFIHEAGSTLYI
jgi:hypothetical protein